MYFLGLMSGTSMDAVDVTLVDFGDSDFKLVSYDEYPVPAAIQTAIREVNLQTTLDEISRLDVALGHLFAECVISSLTTSGTPADKVQAIGSHGQTVLHMPDDPVPRTLQIGNPSIITARTGILTVADFRQNDIAAGGQGAPLAPAFHTWNFRDPVLDRVVLNLGGIANLTVLPSDITVEVTGFDTGPGNGLMDAWSQRHGKGDFDADGKWAQAGRVNKYLLDVMLNDTYFAMAPPKSTGRDKFNLAWLEEMLNKIDEKLTETDIQSTLLELSARTVADAVKQYAANTRELLVCGGGIHNLTLLHRIMDLLTGISVASTADHGLDPNAVEAVTFAWLAKCRLENRPGNLPSVTGSTRPVLLGSIYKS